MRIEHLSEKERELIKSHPYYPAKFIGGYVPCRPYISVDGWKESTDVFATEEECQEACNKLNRGDK